jgi:cell division protein FtsA
VDLGASKVACFIMRPEGVRRADRSLVTAGVGYVQSHGVRAGAIVDAEEAARAVAQAVERAETMAGVDVQGVVVSTACGHLASHRVAAQVSIGGRPIGDADKSRAVVQAMAGLRLARRQAIHLQPIAWSVDGERRVRDPAGLVGRKLGLELLVISMQEAAFQTIRHCVERAHLQFEGVVAAPFASALAALEEDEMQLGAICIDMGGGSTSVAVWSGGALVHVDSFGVGGQHVTQDIARGLSTSIAGAERIKTLHGSATASANEDREMIEAPPRGDDPGAGPVTAPRSMLKGIIAPRVEETFEKVPEAGRGPDRSRSRRRPGRRGEPADRRARGGRAGLRPAGAAGASAPHPPPRRRRRRTGLLLGRRCLAARRLRTAGSGAQAPDRRQDGDAGRSPRQRHGQGRGVVEG